MADRVRAGLQAIQAIEHRQRFIGRRTPAHRDVEQPPRFLSVTSLERGDTAMEQFLGLALQLGQRATSPLDVGTSPWVTTIEKERPRPDVDRLFVLGREIVIEAGQEELLDLRVPIQLPSSVVRVRRTGRQRIGHGWKVGEL